VKRVYFHIGLHKTGTTYVQQLLRANRKALRREGVFYAGGKGLPNQVFAVWDLLGRRPQGEGDARIAGSWQGLVDAVSADDDPVVMLSDEHLSLATAKQAATAVEAFGDREPHVVVTARDLARTLGSAWQEEIKNRGAWTWAEFSAAVRDPRGAGTNPARGFWLRQDLPAILGVWARSVPVERIHVVTVPPAGAPAGALVQRLGSVVGFDPAELTREAPWANETIGVVGTELVRRLNPMLTELPQRQYDRAIKRTVVRLLAERTAPVRFALPPDDLAWARGRGAEMVAAVRTGGYPVVGDLADLLSDDLAGPGSAPGRLPDRTSSDEVLADALQALAGLAEQYVELWWETRGPEEPVEADTRARGISQARALAFKGRRAAARLADRNPVAGRALGAVLRRRST